MISGCKAGHKTEDLQLDELGKTQNIDQSKIKCKQCQTSKSEALNNKLFTCYTCKQNLCQSCFNIHDKSHQIKDYEENQFFCKIHLIVFVLTAKKIYAIYARINIKIIKNMFMIILFLI